MKKEAIQQIAFFPVSLIPGVIFFFVEMQLLLNYKGCCSGNWKENKVFTLFFYWIRAQNVIGACQHGNKCLNLLASP